MLITCNNCETIFEIDKTKIDPNGQQVRCSVCSHVWTVYEDDEQERTPPKLNLDANRNEGLNLNEESLKIESPKLNQDSSRYQKKKGYRRGHFGPLSGSHSKAGRVLICHKPSVRDASITELDVSISHQAIISIAIRMAKSKMPEPPLHRICAEALFGGQLQSTPKHPNQAQISFSHLRRD